MFQPVLISLVIILVLGIGAQWIAWWLRLPSIVLLLLLGFLAGPVAGLLDPDAIFDRLLFPMVSISVAIILFEGGLSLKFSDLKRVGGVVRNLVTSGLLITWILGTLAAWAFLRFDLSLAALLGAILVVTGPTVIIPIIRSLQLSGRVGSILKWEAILNDAIGAIFSVLVFEAILVGGFQQATGQVLIGLLKTIILGASLGILAASMLVFFLKKYLIPDFLQSPVTLMVVAMVFALSNYFQAESGLVSVTIMGILLANQKQIEIAHIAEFKENLRTLLISSLFIVLAARLELKFFTYIGWSSLIFVALIIFVIRPLAVFVSAFKSELNMRERFFLAFMAPRGIVAAAVSSIFALHLERAGYPGADRLISMTFFVIIVTVLTYGISAPWVARLAKVSKGNPQGILILGAHYWARKIASALEQEGFRVLLVDTNYFNIRSARDAGLRAEQGNILSKEFVNQLDLEGIGRFLALTANDEVNSLAALHCAEIFGRSEVYQVSINNENKGDAEISPRLKGRFLFGESVTFYLLNDLFRKQSLKKVVLTKDYTYEIFLKEHQNKAIPLFILNEAKELKITTAKDSPKPQEGHSLLILTQ